MKAFKVVESAEVLQTARATQSLSNTSVANPFA